MQVQLRHGTRLTSEEYVKQQAWRNATLERCPLHPEGGCGFRRHGTYTRKAPEGVQVPRWYCPTGHKTFSLLPDCVAARLSSSLQQVETVIERVEAAPSVEAAASALRPDIELPGAIRWVRRRLTGVRAALVILLGLCPSLLMGRPPTLSAFREALGVAQVLPACRELAERQLGHIPAPVGFAHRPRKRPPACPAQQQKAGPDPAPGGG